MEARDEETGEGMNDGPPTLNDESAWTARMTMQRVHVPVWLRPKASRQNAPSMRRYELERPVILEASLFRGFCLL